MVSINLEKKYWNEGLRYIAGIDEAGRGPLAGPVVAAAVMFPKDCWIEGIDDSKKLSAKRREELFDVIANHAMCFGIGIISHSVVDVINILQATFQAMDEAINALIQQPQQLLVDGNRFHKHSIPNRTIVDGDALSLSIAAASILAKVTRDRLMLDYDKKYPEYGFARHKGYGTKEHIAAIRKYGLCEIHRRSFHLRDRQLSLFERR